MNLIIFGPPGAGKGTQANIIAKNFNLKQISTGDLLRNEIEVSSTLGKEIKLIIDKGEFVDDKIVNRLVRKVISIPENHNRLVFDGFPRNVSQAVILEQLLNDKNQKISAVFILDVKREVITKRINGRITCSKCLKIFNEFFNPPNNENHSCDVKFLQRREDDKSKVLLSRFENYAAKTKPVLDYYKKKNFFYKIDGNKEIDQIYIEIKDILENIRD